MIRILSLLGLLTWASAAPANMLLTGAGGGGGGTAIALTGTPFGNANALDGASVSATGDIGTGEMVAVISVWCDDSSCGASGLTSASVTAAPTGNTCTSVGQLQDIRNIQIFQCPNSVAATGGTFTVTADATVFYLQVCVARFTNVKLTSPGYGSATATGNSTTPAVSVTTTESGDLVIGQISGGTFTSNGQTSLCDGKVTYKVAGAAGAQNQTWVTASAPWWALGAGFLHQ